MNPKTRPLTEEGQGLFSGRVRRGFAGPEDLRPSQWAEKYRVLTRRQSSRPGPWRNENAPPLAVVMDLCVRRAVRELWVKKAAQVGVSEAVRNVIAYLACREPDPLLLVLPNEKDGRKIVRKRVIPLFEDTEVLAALSTGSTRDKKLTAVTLSNGFDLQLGWSGSPSSLASDPIRTVVLDEVDKFETYAGAEASPVDLARVRTRTYGERALVVAISTPTTSLGPISVGFDDCPIQLHFYAPCPHCGAFQRLVFDRLKWEKFKELPDAKSRAARIRARKAAWYECAGCEGRIVEAHKRAIFQAGYFGTADVAWKIYCDGREEGQQPEGEKVGVHYPGLVDLSTTFASIAAEFVEADGRPEKLMHFYNSTLGEEYRDRVVATTVNTFAAKCVPDPEKGFVPPRAKVLQPWVSRLLMTVDTQIDYFWFVIRAWGSGFRSHRVHHGRASSFQELEELFYRAYFPYEGNPSPYPPLRCHLLGIDSGGGLDRDRDSATRTDQVYQWCNGDPLMRLPLKGASKPFEEHIRWRDVLYQDPHRQRDAYRVRLHFLDPLYWRDLLSSYIVGKVPVVDPETGEVDDGVDQWMLNDVNDEEYNRHLSNMTKVKLRKGRAIVEQWTTKTAGARKDYHDVETEQLAMAHGPGRCFALPTPEQIARLHQPAPLTPAATTPASSKQITAPAAGVRMPDGRPFLATRR